MLAIHKQTQKNILDHLTIILEMYPQYPYIHIQFPCYCLCYDQVQ